MRLLLRSSVVPLSLLLLAALAPVRAETSADAQKWLTKMQETVAKGPISVTYTAKASGSQMGQQVSLEMNGSALHGTGKRSRMELKVKMSMHGMTMDLEMLGVSDGKTVWIESTNPMMGGRQVMKIPAEKAGEMTTLGQGMQMGGTDPIGELARMGEQFDFQVVDVSGGRVTLKAKLDEETLAELKSVAPDAAGIDNLTLVLDEKTAFPVAMRMGGEPPLMTMDFSDPVFLESVDDSQFQYTPPEGTNVIDVEAMGGMPGQP